MRAYWGHKDSTDCTGYTSQQGRVEGMADTKMHHLGTMSKVGMLNSEPTANAQPGEFVSAGARVQVDDTILTKPFYLCYSLGSWPPARTGRTSNFRDLNTT